MYIQKFKNNPFLLTKKLPGNYFQEVIDAQREMVRIYLNNVDNPLVFSPYCGTTVATFKFYSCETDDASPLLHYTFSNLVDLKDHLYSFWLQLMYLLKED